MPKGTFDMKKKLIIMITALVLLFSVAVIGTIAWLLDTTDPVVNTFSPSTIEITLTETNVDNGSALENTYKMLPGTTIDKDPKVTVVAGSEECYLYVKVEKNNTVDDYLTVAMASGWTQIGTSNVWYYSGTITQGTPIPVLANNKVTVNNDVTKEMMDALSAGTTVAPKLTFTAYAVQVEAGANAEAAWAATYGKTN